MKTNVLNVIILLVVGVILAGSLLVPVVQDAQEGARSTVTNGAPRHYLTDYSEGTTIVVDPENKTATINDVAYSYSSGTKTLILCDGFVINTYNGTATLSDGTAQNNIVEATTITINNGAANVVNGSNSTDYPITWAMGIADEGKYGIYSYNGTQTLYVNSINDITMYSASSSSAPYYYWTHDGTAGTNMALNASITPVDDRYSDFNQITSATLSYNGVEKFTNSIIVPVEVTIHDDVKEFSALYGVIPVLVIVALLMAAIGMIAIRRD